MLYGLLGIIKIQQMDRFLPNVRSYFFSTSDATLQIMNVL